MNYLSLCQPIKVNYRQQVLGLYERGFTFLLGKGGVVEESMVAGGGLGWG